MTNDTPRTPINLSKGELLAKLAGLEQNEYYGKTVTEFYRDWIKSKDENADVHKVLTMKDCLEMLADVLAEDEQTQPQGT